MSTIVVARERDRFSELLTDAGIQVINCPVIRTEEADDLLELRESLNRLPDYRAIFLTSRAAAEAGVACPGASA